MMIESTRVDIEELETGMFVASLDRPWLETPFMLQGFVIRDDSEIELLRKHCRYVYVDTRKSTVRETPPDAPRKLRPLKKRKDILKGRPTVKYRDSVNWEEEYSQAKVAYHSFTQEMEHIFDEILIGGTLDIVRIKKSVDPVIDSIIRNPDACIWLARLKQQDQYTYQHSLGASIWAVALGRQLGLPKPDLRSLAVGGALFDIGKLRVPPDLLSANRKLSQDEFESVRRHVDLGMEMIGDSIINRDILDMVAHHHERHDGSGYPQGLKGDEIPVFARIAAIVDCYDAITSHRSYARAIPPYQAIKKLYEWKDIDFQAELVEQFIQAVGIYPAGTLVELSSGEVAVVVAEYRTRRLRPKVMVLLDRSKQALSEPKTIDLLHEITCENGELLEIVSSLEPEAYGIDIAAIHL